MTTLQASPNVLNAGSHADTFIAPTINAVLGNGKVDNPIYVDYDNLPGMMLSDATNPAASSIVSVASGLSVNHAPYSVLNASTCCWSPAVDETNYATLVSGDLLFAQPEAVKTGIPPVGTPPPTVMLSASSPNSGNGGTGWGVEFGLSTSYLGLDTSEDSWVSAGTAGLAAALRYNHPAWNLFDTKAALRVTAANWSTGYDPNNFGYGFVNWTSANAGPTLYLQPPGLKVVNNGDSAVITLYPFKQTRRSKEVLYSVSASYVWPVKNEYTLGDITASGATLLYTSNGTDVTPTYTYLPAVSGTITLIAFTTDGNGAYSREEVFSKVPVTLTVSSQCWDH